MPVREESFRIGCGRYLQGAGYLSRCGEEVLRHGTAPLVIGDDTTLAITRETLVQSIAPVCKKYEIVTHNGTCNEPDANILAELCREKGYDVIVGVGGGVLMDFAKLCAHFANIPVINVPTSSATCASFASLSVRYTREGRTVGALHYQREVDGVIADTEILAAQPVRLLLAGVFDALAKFLEIKQRFSEKDCPLGLDYAFVMSEHSFRVLTQNTAACIADMARGEVTQAVEQVIFTAIAATGVISGIARGSNQCALAHKFYETVRYLFPETAAPYLHGEIVGVGLLLQNYFNGEVEQNDFLLSLMRQHSMPYSIAQIGVTQDAQTMQAFYDRICTTSAIDETNPEECKKFKEGLEYLWNIR